MKIRQYITWSTLVETSRTASIKAIYDLLSDYFSKLHW